MTSADAAKILELPVDASPEQVEARFFELRAKLEDKIAKAPTPGLKEKYRGSLGQVTQAFETLVLAADAATLPVLHQAAPAQPPREERAFTPSPPKQAPPPATPVTTKAQGRAHVPPARKGANHEFRMVVMVAVLVLGVGAWWVMKTRSDNAEKARVVAEKAAAETTAKQVAALEKQLADEAAQKKAAAEKIERERLDAEEKEERTRQEKLIARLRTELAEARISWEACEREERKVEREANELKSDLRNPRDLTQFQVNSMRATYGATQRYYEWLRQTLEEHPARIARAKTEELISAKMADDAEVQLGVMKEALAALVKEIPERRAAFFDLEGSLRIESDPAGLNFEVTDAFGHVRRGTTPSTLNDVSPGSARVTVSRNGYETLAANVEIATGKTASRTFSLRSHNLAITAEPDVEFWMNGRLLGQGRYVFVDQPPGRYNFELRRRNFAAYRTSVVVQQTVPNPTVAYSFTDLAAQRIFCDSCSGQGKNTRNEWCSDCQGSGSKKCSFCNGNGGATLNGQFIACPLCRDGQVRCKRCNGAGNITHHDTCTKCSGDGRLSKLDTQ